MNFKTLEFMENYLRNAKLPKEKSKDLKHELSYYIII